MSETLDVRLARIEERLHHVVHQLEKLMAEAHGLAEMQQEVGRHRQELQRLHATVHQARGMAVIISAIVAFVAAHVPEIFMKR